MGIAQFDRMLAATRPVVLPPLDPVAVQVRGLNERLWAIIRKPTPLTDEEQAYLDACERGEG